MVDSEKPKHTPGPWRFEESQGGAWFIYGETGDNQPIAPRVKVPKRGTKLMRANARLMAAAPDMLKALEGLMEILANTPLPTAVEGYARAAIRKAVGDGR